MCRTAILRLKIGYHSVGYLLLYKYYCKYCIISTTSAGNRSRALKCRHFCNPWDLHNYCPTCRDSYKGVLHLLKNKNKELEIESDMLKKIRLGYPTSPKMNPNSWESRIRVIFLKAPSKSSNRQLKAFTNPHQNPAMSY